MAARGSTLYPLLHIALCCKGSFNVQLCFTALPPLVASLCGRHFKAPENGFAHNISIACFSPQELAGNEEVTVGDVRDFVSRQLAQDTAAIEDDRLATVKYQVGEVSRT